MDEFIGSLVKFLSSTVVARIFSYPPFAIEVFLAVVLCVVHSLLIFEVNTLVKRTNAKAAARLRIEHPIKETTETCSFHSLVTLRTTQVFHHKKPDVSPRTQTYTSDGPRLLHKRFSRANMGWLLSKGDSSIFRHKFSDRVEHLLSISPSEYVRRDKERKSREQGLRSCLQSLTSLLEKALNNDTLEVQNMSKEEIKKSLNALRNSFENQMCTGYLNDFPSPSLQSLLEHNNGKRALKSLRHPEIISSIYHASNVNFSRSTSDARSKNRKLEEDEEHMKSKDDLSVESSDSMNELFRKQSNDFFTGERRDISVN